MKALELLEKVQSECIASDHEQAFPEAISDGEHVRQGDIYIWAIDSIPVDAVPIKPRLQLVEGTTKGSRHCLDSLEGVEMFSRPDADALQGPLLRLSEERTITHPEHGDWKIGPRCIEITYQRAFAEELKRTAD